MHRIQMIVAFIRVGVWVDMRQRDKETHLEACALHIRMKHPFHRHSPQIILVMRRVIALTIVNNQHIILLKQCLSRIHPTIQPALSKLLGLLTCVSTRKFIRVIRVIRGYLTYFWPMVRRSMGCLITFK